VELLNRLNARLAALSELHEIVIAMRSMAASAMQEGSNAIPAVRRYSEAIQSGLTDVAAIRGFDAIGTAATEDAPGLLCLIGSEHGFVGNFNHRLVDHIGQDVSGFALLAVGRRLATAAADAGLTVRNVVPMPGHLASVPLAARRIAEDAIQFDRIQIATAVRGADGEITVKRRDLLPIPPAAFRETSAAPPMHQFPADELFRQVGAEYVLAELARALVESLVLENDVRLRVLTAADQNIAEKVEALAKEANAQRQQEITAELIDIVTGAEAIETGSR